MRRPDGTYSTVVVARAREHYEAGWKLAQIRRLLEREFGVRPASETVHGWVDMEFQDRRRSQTAVSKRRHRARTLQPQRRVSRETKLARVREMFLRGVSLRAIGQVAAVWWGEEMSEEEVRAALGLRKGDVSRARPSRSPDRQRREVLALAPAGCRSQEKAA